MVKFLIIRFSSIGDIVLTTPVIRCLKNQVEGAEVHFLTKKQFFPVIRANPYIDKIHLLEDDIQQLIKELKKEQFHYIIDLHRNLRSRRIKIALRTVSFSFHKLNMKKWLLVNFKKNFLPGIHIVDRYMQTVSLFDVENDEKGLDYFIPTDEETDISQISSSLSAGFIAVVTGANHVTKQVPDDMLSELINSIHFPVVLLGGKEDCEKAENIIKGCTAGKAFNLCGKLTINQSASVVKQALLVVTPDTGLMHIASAFKKRIISVWGNTVPEFGMHPYLPGEGSELFEVKGLSCRPCSKIGYKKCPKGHFRCMRNQDVKAISEAVKRNAV